MVVEPKIPGVINLGPSPLTDSSLNRFTHRVVDQ
jgi:hypothetical protein